MEKTHSSDLSGEAFLEPTSVKRRTQFYVKGTTSSVIQMVYQACKKQNANPVLKENEVKFNEKY